MLQQAQQMRMSYQSIRTRATVTEATYARYLCSYNENNIKKEPDKKVVNNTRRTRVRMSSCGMHDVRQPDVRPRRLNAFSIPFPKLRE